MSKHSVAKVRASMEYLIWGVHGSLAANRREGRDPSGCQALGWTGSVSRYAVTGELIWSSQWQIVLMLMISVAPPGLGSCYLWVTRSLAQAPFTARMSGVIPSNHNTDCPQVQGDLGYLDGQMTQKPCRYRGCQDQRSGGF